MVAKYKCIKCNHKWKDKPVMTACPLCGYKYVQWTNYETMYRKHFKKMYNDEGIS